MTWEGGVQGAVRSGDWAAGGFRKWGDQGWEVLARGRRMGGANRRQAEGKEGGSYGSEVWDDRLSPLLHSLLRRL